VGASQRSSGNGASRRKEADRFGEGKRVRDEGGIWLGGTASSVVAHHYACAASGLPPLKIADVGLAEERVSRRSKLDKSGKGMRSMAWNLPILEEENLLK
jgi:hypothetical protein